MATSLGVAVVGLGIGEQHARAYAALPQCEVRALVDLNHERVARIAGGFPGSAALTNFADVLDDDSIDIVSIASFDDAHFGASRRGAGRRQACLCRKAALSRPR